LYIKDVKDPVSQKEYIVICNFPIDY